jgi:hypothetical protein
MRDSRPIKICAAVTPQSTAGVLLKTVSVATCSLRRLTLQAGDRERQCCLRVLETRPLAWSYNTKCAFDGIYRGTT